jgi:carotenoid cleavage dioxygenase-like enzyme
VSSTPIPTERKVILARLTVLMQGLYQVVLRGHLIDNDYLGVRVQYLIRENCKSASFGFGWKYLKHLTNSYKDDQEFIAKEVLTNNSCSWFVNEDYFNSRLKNIKPEKILLDKYLIPLHEGEVTPAELKKIFAAVEPQIETEFVTIPPKSSAVEVARVVDGLESLCLEIEGV